MDDSMGKYMESSQTDPNLAEFTLEYVKEWGGKRTEKICRFSLARFTDFRTSQDMIGWHRFLDGMILKEYAPLQQKCAAVSGSRLIVKPWVSGHITRPLEITHRQWLYRNYMVHDSVKGTLATKEKKRNCRMKLEISKN